MEEKSVSDMNLSISDWKLKQQSLRNLRNYRQLENRLLILEMERQAKVKSIQHKLDAHKKMMEVRMDRFKLKQEIQKHDQSLSEETGTNSRVFREVRIARAGNIRTKSTQFRETNHQLFQQAKRQRRENQQRIKQQAQRQVLLKTEKRNRVRLIEIETKQNIDKFWRRRLGGLREARRVQMQSRLQQQQMHLQELVQLQRSEQELLNEIKRTEQMQAQLESMMQEERSVVLTTINASQIHPN